MDGNANSSTVNIITDQNLKEEEEEKQDVKQKTNVAVIKLFKQSIPFIILALLTGHFIWATIYYINNTKEKSDFNDTLENGYGFLVIFNCFIIYGYFYAYFLKNNTKYLQKFLWLPICRLFSAIFSTRLTSIGFYVLILGAILGYVIYDSWNENERLISIAGLIFFLVFGFTFSKHRSAIKWHTILRGIILQFCFGLLTLRWSVGRSIFQTVGNLVTYFLGYAQDGAVFVYGERLVKVDNVFAFSAISTIYFLAFTINILYHIGVMQKIVVNLGLFLQMIMGTSICESVNSAANIFLGQTEAPLLLKPYLKHLTTSELHAVMTGGFASVSGTVLAAYISFGANPAHLITASVMAAPAGLVYSKLMFPEVESTAATKESIELAESEYSSVLDAASQGATQATHIVLGIGANLIAFIATVYFINGLLEWYSRLIGAEEPWSVELIVGYVFMPISFLMGVPWEECGDVGRLIGLKSMVNEFTAFAEFEKIKEDLSDRSKIIATFAICGFANPGSIGIMISALGTLIPNKTNEVTAHVFRAFVSGSIVCFTTACIAGILSTST